MTIPGHTSDRLSGPYNGPTVVPGTNGDRPTWRLPSMLPTMVCVDTSWRRGINSHSAILWVTTGQVLTNLLKTVIARPKCATRKPGHRMLPPESARWFSATRKPGHRVASPKTRDTRDTGTYRPREPDSQRGTLVTRKALGVIPCCSSQAVPRRSTKQSGFGQITHRYLLEVLRCLRTSAKTIVSMPADTGRSGASTIPVGINPAVLPLFPPGPPGRY